MFPQFLYTLNGVYSRLKCAQVNNSKKEGVCCFLKFFFIVIQLQLYAFSPHPSTPPQLNPPPFPHLYPPPWLCPCVLYSSSCNPLSSQSPPHSPSTIVRLFLTSMSLVIFCLLFSLVDYVPVKGEIIWYLSLTAWLITFSIYIDSVVTVCVPSWVHMTSELIFF